MKNKLFVEKTVGFDCTDCDLAYITGKSLLFFISWYHGYCIKNELAKKYDLNW